MKIRFKVNHTISGDSGQSVAEQLAGGTILYMPILNDISNIKNNIYGVRIFQISRRHIVFI